MKPAASSSQVGRIEAWAPATEENLVAFADLSKRWPCRGNAIPVVAESKYDFRDLGGDVESVG